MRAEGERAEGEKGAEGDRAENGWRGRKKKEQIGEGPKEIK
jgi:hypothetical protein